MHAKIALLRTKSRPSVKRLRVESLEDRMTPTALWRGYAMDGQHTALSTVASQPLNAIRWQTPVDQQPQYNGNDLLIHYGSPSITNANTVIVPVKTGASGGFQVSAFNGSTGAPLWTRTSAYQLPPSAGWTSSFGAVLTPSGRYYFADNGGTVSYIDSPDGAGVVTGKFAFFGLANYNANQAAYNGSVFIDTPLTADAGGNIYFGFRVTGANPINLVSGLARIAPNGAGTWVSAQTMMGDANINDRVVYNCAPAISNNGQTVYVAVNNGSSGVFATGDLVAVNSSTLAVQNRVALIDPSSGSPAYLPDIGTASPTVGPDGDVYMGVLENSFPHNNDRGWLLHFSGDLLTTKIPGAFGWDDTASIVPAALVPSYAGSSSYLLMTKYNNYAGVGSGDGHNKIAILDPNSTESFPVPGNPNMQAMDEVLSILGVTPDDEHPSYPGAVREWCINNAVVDPATDSILANSEDGRLYRWDLTTNKFTQSITLTDGIGEAYTPTLIGADGAVYAINNAILFAVGNFQPSATALTNNPSPSTFGTPVTFTATVTGPAWTATGTVTFFDGSTQLGASSLDASGVATFNTSVLHAGLHHITAQYGGDEHFAVSTSPEKLQTVDKEPTSTTLNSTIDTTSYGQDVALTATVTGSTVVPLGTVAFLDGGTTIGSVSLDSNGIAILHIATLNVGVHHITAEYGGEDDFVSSGSQEVQQVVNKAPTTTTLNTSGSPTTYGQTIALVATIDWTPPNFPPSPTGIVYFYDGSTLLGGGGVSGNQAVLNISTLSPGLHHLTAQYGGDAYHDLSTSSVVDQQVNGIPALGGVPSFAQINEGQTLSFTATASNTATPFFSLVGAPVGASIDSGSGAFSWTPTEAQGPGTFVFTVRLTDGAIIDDKSITVQVGEVNAAPVLSGVPSSLVTAPGTSISFTATAADADLINGLPNTLTFSLVGAPGNASIDPDTGEFTWTPDETNPLGIYTFKVRVADDGVPSMHDTKTLVVNLAGAVLENSGSLNDLLVGGTGANDAITVNLSKDASQVVVKNGKSTLGSFSVASLTGRIVVHGLGGNDRITISPKIANGADLHGDAGNDVLVGGSGDDRIFGGAGDDRLTGGIGNDLLVGGDGNDRLSDTAGTNVLLGGNGADTFTGGKGDDLLVAGPTAVDTDLTGLSNILAEWTSGSTYVDRIAHLTGAAGGANNGTFLLPGVTVSNDGVRDVLTGGKGTDLFFASSGDKVDRKDPEQAITV